LIPHKFRRLKLFSGRQLCGAGHDEVVVAVAPRVMNAGSSAGTQPGRSSGRSKLSFIGRSRNNEHNGNQSVSGTPPARYFPADVFRDFTKRISSTPSGS
jgi:hypothetical protein